MHFTSDQQCLLHLSLIEDIGPAVIHHLVNSGLLESLDQLYSFSASELRGHFDLTELRAENIFKGLQNKRLLEIELDLIERHNITVITLKDPEYPVLLSHIYLPPPVLYRKGAPLNDHAQAVAIIGSRQAGAYAEQVIKDLVPPLVQRGLSIISGGALGADTMAHAATLQNKGKTVAVLGSGLLHLYPARNKHLFGSIVENKGSIISPFPLLMEPLQGNFPARNRIISGMSRGCIVIQAALQSGARITAQCALEQGREVFAIPGSFFDPLSEGCHALIQQGATLVAGVGDILAGLGYAAEEESAELAAADKPSLLPEKQLVLLEEKPLEKGSEAQIIALCALLCTFDELHLKTALSFVDLNDALFNLQLGGRLTQTSAGLWQTVR